MLVLGRPPSTVMIDEECQSRLAFMASPTTAEKAHHVDIAHHMVRERVTVGQAQISYIPGMEMPAVRFMKALPNPAFTYFLSCMTVYTVGACTPMDGPVM